MDNPVLPNFLIVGAPRAGTTSLYYYLKSHPEIFLSMPKEPFFLAFAGEKFSDPEKITPSLISRFTDYQRLFRDSGLFPARGEASTYYLYFHRKTIANIKKYFPDHRQLKIIAVLRNPAKRAFSHYLFNKRNGKENLPFMEALRAEASRKKNGGHFTYYYQSVGFYHEQIKDYLDNFDRVKIILFDDYAKDPLGTVRALYSFLEVDAGHVPDTGKIYNPAGEARSKILLQLTYGNNPLNRLLTKILPKKLRDEMTRLSSKYNLRRTAMKTAETAYLQKLYQLEIKKLSGLTGQDLSMWQNKEYEAGDL